MSGFEQAVIKIEKEQEFEELKSAIIRVFVPEKVVKFLNKVQSAGLRIRHVEPILQKGLIEQVDGTLKKSGKTGNGLYQSLPMTDQAQMREFYLSKIEEVSPELRSKFQKIYRYY